MPGYFTVEGILAGKSKLVRGGLLPWVSLVVAVMLLLAPVSSVLAEEPPRQGDTPPGAYNVDAHNSHVTDAAIITALDLAPAAVSSMSFGSSDHNGFNAFTTAASGFPTQGSSYLVMSSGCTSSALQSNNSGSTTCVLAGSNNSQGNDLVQLTLTLNVPAGAKSWIVDWKFFSEEFPEYVGSPFNDAFLIERGSSNFTISGISDITAPNNVAFDANGKNITINTTGALGMNATNAAGTTYDGATTTLSTAADLPSGATSLTLIFTVTDLGDSILDTTVFIDNFRFSSNEVGDPTTEPAEICGNGIDDDGDGQVDEGCNQDPVADAGSDQVVNEGATVTLNASNSTDPDAGDTLSYSWALDQASSTGPPVSLSSSTVAQPTFLTIDDGFYRFRVTVSDGKGGTDTDEVDITVNNVAPVLTINTPTFGQLFASGPVNLAASFTDAGTNDTHTCQINWDVDGVSPLVDPGAVSETNGSGTCSGSRTLGAGVYTIDVMVTDDNNGSDTERVMIVVYDPSAGFVTGGGWIASPAGAYTADPSLSGRANFGFVSKYKAGATTPTGQTEFHFQVANFKFHSSLYDWLVVSGAKSQYKGTGAVNGTPGYGFLLTATDGQINGGGGVDKFRIKIWDKATETIVYDNMPGTSEDIDSANPQALGGGSIVIHKGN